MRTILCLVRTHWRLLRREPGYWIVTVGLAVCIIVVYGSLFADPASPKVGLVVEDDSVAVEAAVRQFTQVGEIDVTRGTREKELQALRDGQRWAVLSIPAGFAERVTAGDATAEITYIGSNPFEATMGRGVLRQFVADLTQALSPDGSAEGQLRVEERTVPARKTLGLLDLLFPGVVGMSLMFGSSWAASTIVSWRQIGILRRVGSSPLHPLSLEVAQLVVFGMLSGMQVIVLIVMANLLFDVTVIGSYLDLALVTGLGTVAFMGIWYAFAAILPSTNSFFSFLNLAAFLMMFLSGSAFPIENVPAALHPIVQALPLTHLNEALQAVINRGEGMSSYRTDLLILSGWALLGFGASIRVFRWIRE